MDSFWFLFFVIFSVLSICIYSWISLSENNTKSTSTNTTTPTNNNNKDSHDTWRKRKENQWYQEGFA